MGYCRNRNQYQPDLLSPEIKNPVSLKQITGKQFNPLELSKELCSLLDRRFTELRETGFENIYTTYLDHLYKKVQQ